MVAFSAPIAREAPSARWSRQGKGSGKGSGKAPRHWEAGKKLTNVQVWHCAQDMLSKYAGKSRITAAGDSTAIYETLAKPQVLASPQAAAEVLDARNTEIVNRPGYGLSELAGCLLSWLDSVEYMGTKKAWAARKRSCRAEVLVCAGKSSRHTLFPLRLMHFDPNRSSTRRKGLSETHHLRESCELLNAQDYPDLERSIAPFRQPRPRGLARSRRPSRPWCQYVGQPRLAQRIQCIRCTRRPRSKARGRADSPGRGEESLAREAIVGHDATELPGCRSPSSAQRPASGLCFRGTCPCCCSPAALVFGVGERLPGEAEPMEEAPEAAPARSRRTAQLHPADGNAEEASRQAAGHADGLQPAPAGRPGGASAHHGKRSYARAANSAQAAPQGFEEDHLHVIDCAAADVSST